MTIQEQLQAGLGASQIREQAADMAEALRALKPNPKHVREQLFSLLYPVIVELLDQNVTQRAILDLLQAKGLKLHPARFKELMASQAKANAGESEGGEAQL